MAAEIKTQSKNPRIFYALDGLRGIAALAVVERHKTDFFTGTPMPAGYLAVDLFFILSGFVLSHAYGTRLKHGMSVFAFMKARIIRLAPLYWLATVFSAMLFAALIISNPRAATEAGYDWANWVGSLVTALFMVPTPQAWSLMPDRLFPLNDPAWSLFFEMLVNFVFAAFILSLTMRTLGWLIATGLAVLVFCVFINGNIDIGFNWETIWSGFPRVTFGFFAGVLLHRLWSAQGSPTTLKGPLANAAGWVLGAILIACMLVYVPPSWRPVYELAVVALVFPALVYCGACIVPTGVSLKAFIALGAASYGIYVFHLPAARAFGQVLEMAGLEPAHYTPWTGLVFATLLVLACQMLDKWFDRPMRRRLTAYFLPSNTEVKYSAPTDRLDARS